MSLLYIAGPFSASTDEEIRRNITRASCAAARAWERGWAVICPHKNTAGFQHLGMIPPRAWYRGDLEILARCDAVLMLPGWEQSFGATVEWAFMTMVGKPVWYLEHGIPEPPLEAEA